MPYTFHFAVVIANIVMFIPRPRCERLSASVVMMKLLPVIWRQDGPQIDT